MSKNYHVLARKYRPQTFADLMGQDVLVDTLTNAIKHHRIPHAILLTGVRGIGKTTTARIIARALNCVGEDGKGGETISPCGKCQPCVDILADRHLDVIEMDAASRTSVDDIRKVIEAAYYKPSSARYKVQIIDEIHMLTKQAFNALLKTLEEPPEYTKFIFATTELNRVPDTIISRCVRFDLKRFDRSTLKDLLQKTCDQEDIKVEAEALSLLAQAANGSARDSQSLLERAISLSPGTITDGAVRSMLGLTGQDDVLNLLQAVLTGETATALTLFDTAYKNGADPDQILRALCDLTHEISCLKISSDFAERSLLVKEQLDQLQNLASTLSVPVLTRLWQVLTKGREELKGAPSSAQAAEMILIRTCYLSELPTAQAVISELTKQQGQNKPNAFLKEPANAEIPQAPKASTPLETPQVEAQKKKPDLAPKNIKPEIAETPPSEFQNLKPNPPESFVDLVALFEIHKEPLLKYEFENHVKFIALDVNKPSLEIELTKGIAPDFVKKVRELLARWTGDSWDIQAHKENKASTKAAKTLRVQNKETKDQLVENARKTLLVKTALEIFPQAEIKDVKLLKQSLKTA
ncbi:MAG TPA: DNA polymerase III subunit gamma/tau [Holosporales bacterium]|nr:DNA polymerase III subunit gamma/tau [Holosporales bacterium]